MGLEYVSWLETLFVELAIVAFGVGLLVIHAVADCDVSRPVVKVLDVYMDGKAKHKPVSLSSLTAWKFQLAIDREILYNLKVHGVVVAEESEDLVLSADHSIDLIINLFELQICFL